jgi:hypothetical protein
MSGEILALAEKHGIWGEFRKLNSRSTRTLQVKAAQLQSFPI